MVGDNGGCSDKKTWMVIIIIFKYVKMCYFNILRCRDLGMTENMKLVVLRIVLRSSLI